MPPRPSRGVPVSACGRVLCAARRPGDPPRLLAGLLVGTPGLSVLFVGHTALSSRCFAMFFFEYSGTPCYRSCFWTVLCLFGLKEKMEGTFGSVDEANYLNSVLSSSEEGCELVERLVILSSSGTLWSGKAGYEAVLDLDLLSSEGVRRFAGMVSAVGVPGYGQPGGVVSWTVESKAFLQCLSYCDPKPDRPLICNRLKQMQQFIVGVDDLFFEKSSQGMKGYRQLKAGMNINWEQVQSFILREEFEFGFTFRHPRVMDAIKDMESCSERGEGGCSGGRWELVGSMVGHNFLCMMCSCFTLGEREGSMLAAIKCFDEQDVCFVELANSTGTGYVGDVREQVLALSESCVAGCGSPAYVVRRQFDVDIKRNSDEFAARSSVFAFLRTRFRAGPQFLRDLPDDYGHPMDHL